MRRRIRAAALPIHRHSLPQLAVDGALVALAYYLAFELRFDNGAGVRARLPYDYQLLRERTIWWVLAGSLVVLVLARVYQRRWRYSGQRDYEAVLRAVLAIVLLSVVAVAVLRPGAPLLSPSRGRDRLAKRRGGAVLPAVPAVSVRRADARPRLLRAPSAGGLPGRTQGRAQRPDRRRRRRRAAGAARDPA